MKIDLSRMPGKLKQETLLKLYNETWENLHLDDNAVVENADIIFEGSAGTMGLQAIGDFVAGLFQNGLRY